ncbi:Uncharacterized protein conserved in bacteria [Elusimicrobium minutum Pei191]|uniref:Uncharacterized protein conserved in bacteria n=1 Tax=Elusimicrobium minutum (strain Pei191) TaxID=445932 RepID=B2KCD5_ELUMP|nr:hypothetical protein [Elusimicrobium minutum]ACC98056.1 Uncharacterized protein conserved in bacteria [Elusimicrobium minutum Pei191]
MEEEIISIGIGKKKLYYKAVLVAQELLDENGYVIRKNGKIPDGKVTEYLSNMQTVKNYKRGILEGKLEVIDIITGKVTMTEEYKDGELKNIIDTATIAPISPKNKNKEEDFPVAKPGDKGLCCEKVKDNIVFYENGSEIAKCSVIDGALVSGNIKNGVYKEYYETGEIKSEACYQNGVLEGPFVKYDELSRIILKEVYSNGRLEGPAAYYIYRGEERITEQAFYKDAKLHGTRLTVFPNGRPAISENYDENKLDGKREVYFENGILSIEENYKKGRLNGPRIFYYYNGAVWYKEMYVNAQLEGERIAYFPSGELYLKEHYKHGLLEGERVVYDKNGTILFSEMYSYGLPVKKKR